MIQRKSDLNLRPRLRPTIIRFLDGVDVFAIGRSFQSKGRDVGQDVLVSAVSDVRLQDLRVDRVPPTMGASDYDVKVARVDVQVVLHPIVADHLAESILQLGRDRVLAGVHMRHLGVLQPLRKLGPRLMGDVVRLTNVQAPWNDKAKVRFGENHVVKLQATSLLTDATFGRLQDTKQVHHLVVQHALVEVLDVERLAVGVFLQGLQSGIDGDRCDVWIVQILLEFEHDHVRVVVLQLVKKIAHA